MRTYKTDTIGGLLACREPTPTRCFSAAALRRRFAGAFVCSGSACKKPTCDSPTAPPPPPASTLSGRLSELLAESSESGSDDPPDVNLNLEEFRSVARRLQCEEHAAARDVRRLAKYDPGARETLATLGAIPPLVAMLDHASDPEILVPALYGLLNLGIRNNPNKAEMVKAGAVHKMMDLVECGCSVAVADAIVANFLGLTALDANKPVVGASGAIPFLVMSFRGARDRPEAREDAVKALYNLSLEPCNAAALVEAGAVEAMAGAIGEAEMSERAVGVVANVVGASAEGRRVASGWVGAVAEALEWGECQENAAYVMMVMAHGGYGERIKEEKGAVTALLEVALVGTPLAQRRAARALECLRVGRKGKGKGKGVAVVVVGDASAPQCAGEEREGGYYYCGEGEESGAVRELVRQSLQCNMRRIARRANLVGEGSDHLRAMAGAARPRAFRFEGQKKKKG